MSQLECEITIIRDDGSARWRRQGAFSPNGWLEPTLVPHGVSIGSIVVIEFENNAGRTFPVSCRLRETTTDSIEPDVSQHTDGIDSQPTPRSGLLFRVNIMNPLEDENAEGKIRPAVLVSQTGDNWRVMGLTTKSRYSTGELRRPIPNHAAVGLSGPGFIWGSRLTRVTADSIHGFIGFANHQLVEEIIDIARNDMSPSEIDDLRSVTRPALQRSRAITLSKSSGAIPRLSLTSESLLAFFSNNESQIKEDLKDYFLSGNFTGRDFEFFSRCSNPYRFDGNDIAAVMCLSISPHANIASALLRLSNNHNFCFDPSEREIPIWKRPCSDFEPGSRFHDLFDELCRIPNIAAVVASKLMAARFPHSIPIYDRDVSALLNHPEKWWLAWHEAKQSNILRKRLIFFRESLGQEEVSLLRVADVALWMEAQRRKESNSL
jgi:hypothetical protein